MLNCQFIGGPIHCEQVQPPVRAHALINQGVYVLIAEAVADDDQEVNAAQGFEEKMGQSRRKAADL